MGKCICLEDQDFEGYGLIRISETVFQKRNLLIGKNGAGKTRFLRARLESLQKCRPNGYVVVFLDFSSFHINNSQRLPQEDGQNSNVYDLLFNNVPIDFSDFLNVIDRGNESMIEDLFVQIGMNAPASRRQATERLADINVLLLDLIGYTILGENRDVIIQKKDSEGKVIRQNKYPEMIKEFSPGERIIFDICFFVFYLQVVKQKKVVLLMDEPELHLHPRVLLKIMTWLYNSSAVEELWVASHSLFLVPLFQFQELVLFESNRIVPRNSDTYKKLYDDLVGIENINIFEFLKSLDNWQYYSFLVECFCHPNAVSKVNPKDEQFKKFVSALKADKRSTSKVLDYGAGKFRIWDCLQEAKARGMNVNAIKYEAYEPYLSEEIENRLAGKKRPFPLYTAISQIPQNQYDAVVLMNVLHEVDILEWMETLNNIKDILKPNGVLIFLEVCTLLLGEQPYGNTGYLVLGDEEVEKLFYGSEIVKSGPEHGKSNCWVITKEGLSNVTRDSIRDCINQLQEKSFELLHKLFEKKLKLAHSDDPEHKKEIAAREYAFWSQQYINAQLALERFDREFRNLRNNGASIKKLANEPEKVNFPGLRV